MSNIRILREAIAHLSANELHRVVEYLMGSGFWDNHPIDVGPARVEALSDFASNGFEPE